MFSPEELRFFDLIKGGQRMADAAEEAGLSDEEIDNLVLMCGEFLDSERFTTSQYDAAIARRLRKLEEGLINRDESLLHHLKDLSKSVLELVKVVHGLMDAEKGPNIVMGPVGKVVPFPTTNPPKAS